jgi:hypothetical protein
VLTLVGRSSPSRSAAARARARTILPGPVRGAPPEMFRALVEAIRDIAGHDPEPAAFLANAQGAIREVLLRLARRPDGSPDERQMRLIDANFDAAAAVAEEELRSQA